MAGNLLVFSGPGVLNVWYPGAGGSEWIIFPPCSCSNRLKKPFLIYLKLKGITIIYSLSREIAII